MSNRRFGAEVYDNKTIDVDTAEMAVCGMIAIPVSITQVADHIKQFDDIGSALKIGWVGTTAQEAQDWIGRWKQSMVTLFGRPDAKPDDPPAPGENLVGRIASAVTGAATNLAWANQNVIDTFKSFTDPTSTFVIIDDGPQPFKVNPQSQGSQAPSDIIESGPGSG
jgi:hypothetical protein